MKAFKRFLAFLLMLALLVVGGAYLYAGINERPMEPGNKEGIAVTIEEGSTTADIADVLQEAGLIRSKLLFKIESRLTGKSAQYKAGDYEFNKGMSMAKIMDMIAAGKTAGHSITITDGMSIEKIANQLDSQGIVTKEEFLKEVEYGTFDYSFMKYLPKGPSRLEGFLYPDTYQVPLNADAHDIIDMMLNNFDRVMIENGLYQEIEANSQDLYKIITTASMIEREAGRVEDMPNVSSVIKNRLAKDMPLQMCCTVAYVHKKDNLQVTYEDLEIDSPYNTYKNKGLPPGPISNPGLEAIKAAVHPANTDYIYFVASPKMDGTSRFTADYEEFKTFKEEWNKAYEEYVKEHPEALEDNTWENQDKKDSGN